MPELPEVEVSRQGIAPWLEGQIVADVIIRDKRLRWPVPDEVMRAKGQKIMAVRRRAKYLLIDVGVGEIILHLGMTGFLRVVPQDTSVKKHDHVDIVLHSGKTMRFNDARRFGACLWQDKNAPSELLSKLGPEPLTEDFDDRRLYTLSRGRKSAVKTFIMDNAVVVGVGNIYANEALFMAGISPKRAAGNISLKRYQKLTQAIKTVLANAIEQGGTTLRDFSQVDGSPGYFKQELMVYGRAGRQCKICTSTIKNLTLGQRNTFYCPSCQT